MNHRTKYLQPAVDHYETILKDPKKWWWSKIWAAIMLGTVFNMIDNGARGCH